MEYNKENVIKELQQMEEVLTNKKSKLPDNATEDEIKLMIFTIQIILNRRMQEMLELQRHVVILGVAEGKNGLQN